MWTGLAEITSHTYKTKINLKRKKFQSLECFNLLDGQGWVGVLAQNRFWHQKVFSFLGSLHPTKKRRQNSFSYASTFILNSLFSQRVSLNLEVDTWWRIEILLYIIFMELIYFLPDVLISFIYKMKLFCFLFNYFALWRQI